MFGEFLITVFHQRRDITSFDFGAKSVRRTECEKCLRSRELLTSAQAL